MELEVRVEESESFYKQKKMCGIYSINYRPRVWTPPSYTFPTSKSTTLQSKEEELTELTVESTSTNPLHLTSSWLLLKRRRLLPRLLRRRLSDLLPDKEVESLLKSVSLLKNFYMKKSLVSFNNQIFFFISLY